MVEKQQNIGKDSVKGLTSAVSGAVEQAKMLYMSLTMNPRDFDLSWLWRKTISLKLFPRAEFP